LSFGYFFPDLDKTNEYPLLNLLPDGYRSAAALFYPFIKMPAGWKSRQSAFYNMYYPLKEDVYQHGTPLSWMEIKKRSRLNSVTEVAHALHAGIYGGLADSSFHCMYEQIDAVIESTLYYPLEDELSVFLLNPLMDIFSSMGAGKLHYTNLIEGEGSFEISTRRDDDLFRLCTGPITMTDEHNDFVVTSFSI
jgi:hypothetical protein